MSAVAVAKAIESLEIRPRIKWPNDILIDGKKVCGILLELAAQPDRIDYVVVGIGVNANIEFADLPESSRNVTTSLAAVLGERINRVQFTADLLSAFEKECERIDTGDWAGIKADWLQRCLMTGKQVTLSMMSGEVSGRFAGIDDNGSLMLESMQEQTLGQIKSYSAGDVTVKK
jgi:BirA family biotin operon repressor/biotin-[acetyl-CoA-carboxylase] ligase